jgi:gliding motility-associated-like protein
MIHPPLLVDAYSDKDTVCPGDPVLLNINITGGSGYPYTILLDDNVATLPKTVYPSNNQTYTFVVEDNCANIVQDIVQIYNYEKPPLSFTSDILNGCVPLEVKFNETSVCNNCLYTWDFGDNDGISFSPNNNPIHIFENAGVFDISCSVINENGCKNSLVIYQMIEAYPKPEGAFTAIPDVTPIIKPIIDFNNLSEGGISYYWSFDDGDSSVVENPFHQFPAVGYYNVELIVKSIHNCVDTVRYTVRINDIYTFYAPTAFSPDGDGLNDKFKVTGTGINLDEFNLKVYNRWGEVIWETNDIFDGWDGRLKQNGKIAQNATYTWRCVFLDFSGVEHEETGPLTLVK